LVRERTPLPASLLTRLPRLKFIAATGPVNRTIDFDATHRMGIVVSHTAPRESAIYSTAELTWALILAAARHVTSSDQAMRRGLWPSRLGQGLFGRRLGLLGLGHIGQHVARIGRAFGMEVLAWSENLTAQRATDCGVRLVSKEALFRDSDVLSVHVVLSARTKGLVGSRELGLMKPDAILVNTARGPVVDEAALVDTLHRGGIAAAGLDVFEQEPLAANHPLTGLPNVVLTPHLGFSTKQIFADYFSDTVENVLAYLSGRPIRILSSPP
jgi:D-3-phosphoglycerate dehydrogenase